MIVTSLKDGKKYFWVKVPRTATHSYKKLFFPTADGVKIIHNHVPYFLLKNATCENKPNVESGFSVVRHPYHRFVSALRYIKLKHDNPFKFKDTKQLLTICEFCGTETTIGEQDFFNSINTSGMNLLENETTFYDFIYSHFDKNCMMKAGYTWDTILDTNAPSMLPIMFETQTYFAYHPHVKTFKYENLQEFNIWIEDTLGYSTQTLDIRNTSKDIQLNIDVTTKKFKDLVKYLFHEDFKVFGYDI